MASSSAEGQETMQLFIKNVSGQTTTLSVSKTATIADVKALFSSQSSSSQQPASDLRLVFAGKHLTDPSATLASLDITNEATLHVAAPPVAEAPSASTSGTSTPTPPSTSASTSSTKSRKPRCSVKSCTAAAQRIVGDCGFCGGKFCGKHRLLESHACEGLEDCKRESHERNKERLEGERTKAGTGVC